MIRRTFVIADRLGLHVRPASQLAVGLANYRSNAVILFHGREYSAKSAVKVLSACIKAGNTIELRVDGPDEAEAMAFATALIQSEMGTERPCEYREGGCP